MLMPIKVVTGSVRTSVLYRIASVLMVLFAAGHTLGFRKSDPQWRVDTLLASMRSIHFHTQGFDRTYWDFYTGFGLFVTVFLIFAAVVAWQFGGLAASELGRLRVLAWALAICFVAATFLSWQYFFLAPVVFSAVISVCLIAAAWLPPK